jgi:hypothetical protein
VQYLAISQVSHLTCFGHILTNQSIGILVQSPLPGTVRISKVHLDPKCLGNRFVACKLFAIIDSQRIVSSWQRLHQTDNHFFERLRRIVKKAEQLGIVCQVCLFDRCGLNTSDKLAWDNNPYNSRCNVNGLLEAGQNGYPVFCQTEGPIAKINAAFIKKVVDTIGDSSNVIYEIINEPFRELGPLPQSHTWVARELRNNLENPSGSKVISPTGAYNDPEIDLFSMHRAGSESHVQAAISEGITLGIPVILSDDGDSDCMYNPGVAHHVTQRGNRWLQTFFNKEDYIAYLSLLSEWCDRCGVEVWAYCLMPNHVHLIVVPQSEDGPRRSIASLYTTDQFS